MSPISTKRHGDVLIVTSNNPPVNALGHSVRDGLVAAIREADGDDAVKAARRAVEGLALMVVAYGKAQSMSDQPDQYDDLKAYWGQFIDTLMGKVKDVL